MVLAILFLALLIVICVMVPYKMFVTDVAETEGEKTPLIPSDESEENEENEENSRHSESDSEDYPSV